MGDIRETLVLADSFSQTFRNFDAAANASINVAEEFQKALNEFSEGYLDGLVSSLNASRQRLEDMANAASEAAGDQEKVAKAVTKTDDEIRKAKDSEDKFGESIKSSEKAAGSLMGTISKIAGAIGVVKLAENFIETADEMSQITAKLNLINDGLLTTEQMQSAIYNAAQRTRSSYQDTAQLVARIGMNTGDTFKNNVEIVKFAENLNKSFKIAGASAQEQASVILQLSQALAGGLLRGQEFNAVMSGAPNIIKNIADYMGVTVGEMRDLAAEGQITSDIIREAMLGATDDINEKFETLPRTFSDVMTTAKNQITTSLNGAFEEWINTLNNGEMQTAIDNITDAITELARVGAAAFGEIAKAIGWVSENWETVEPLVETAGIAILGYKALNVAAALEVKKAWLEAHAAISDVLAIAGLTYLLTEQADTEIKNAEYSFDMQAQRYGFNSFAELERSGKNTHESGRSSTGGGGIFDFGLTESQKAAQRAATADWYNGYYGSRYSPDDEGFMEVVKASRDQNALYGMWIQENLERHDEEARRAKALEEIKDHGVKVRNEVKLADEDLQIFRDIAENRYIANVSLETLAPSVSVNVENNGQNLSEDDIASAVTKALETQISEHTAISHG